MSLLEKVNHIYRNSLLENQDAMNYLFSRGLTMQTITDFEIGFSGSYCLNDLKKDNEQELKKLGLLNEKGNERNWNRLMFPIRGTNGAIVGYNGRSLNPNDDIKYLLSPESMEFQKSALLYNLHQSKGMIKAKDHVFLVEGVFDVMALHQMGIKNVVCGLGTSLSTLQVQLLSRHTKNVVFAYDSDFAGFEASIKNSLTLSKTLSQHEGYEFNQSTRYLMLPEGRDPSDLLQSPELFKPILHNAKPHLDYCSQSCKAKPEYEQVFEKIRNGDQIVKEMENIPKGQNKQLLGKLDIVDVVSQYASLHKSGQNFKCLCPFHAEKTASLTISPKKQIFKCFGCGESGNAIKFVAQIEKISYQDAMKKLSQNINEKGVPNESKKYAKKAKVKSRDKVVER